LTNNSLEVFAGGWKQLQHADHLQTTQPSPVIPNVRGLDFSVDGLLMYLIDTPDNIFMEFDVSPPWDSSTIDVTAFQFSAGFLGGDAMQIQWSNDGLHCYYTTAAPNTIHLLETTSAHDLLNLSLIASFSPTEETEDIQGSFVMPDEKKFYVLFAAASSGTGIIHEYDMPSKGDLANSVYSGNFINLVPILSDNIRIFSVDPGGRYLYVYERNASVIHRFDFGIIKDISSVVITIDELSTLDKEGLVEGMFIRPTDGKKLYITGLLSDKIDEYDMSLVTNNSLINNDGDEFINEGEEALVSS